MKILSLIIFLFVLVSFVSAEDEILSSRRAELNFHLTGDVAIEYKGAYGQVNYVETELYWFPELTMSQDVYSISSTPESEDLGSSLLFRWETPGEGSLDYSISAELLTNSDYVQVSKYTKFPIEYLDEEYIEYTKEQEIIDINDDIREAAASVASGKDDLYEVVFGLAEYARNNVEYDLSTVTVEASQKASWVLENKVGVCDELTSLFIAMARSLGIPAKFVSGVSYTNLDSFDTSWQAHGWAEVYFPGSGWIPFDVTYGEYGWLDASHIKLHESLDAERTAAEFRSKGKNFELNPGELDVSADIIEVVGRPVPSAEITVEPEWNGISFGSYNVVNVVLENTHDYYVSDSFQFARVGGMELFLPESTHFLLKPYERKELRYMLRVSNDLDDNSFYGFPLQLISDRQVSAANSFRVEALGTYYSEEDAQSLLNLKLDSNGFGNLICTPESDFLYENQSVVINCLTSEEDVEICFFDLCKESDNGAQFFYTPGKTGFNTLEITMKDNNKVIASSFFSIEVLPPATIKFLDVGIDNLKYDESKDLVIKFETDIFLKNINISVDNDNFAIKQSLYDVDAGIHELKYLVKGSNLLPGENEIHYRLDFVDKKGRKYFQETSSSTLLTDSPWHHRIWGWFVRTLGKIF